jgi:hypothetical protein
MTLALAIKNIMTRNGRALYISNKGTLYISNGYDIFCSDNEGLSWRLNATVHEKRIKATLAKCRIPARFLRYYVAAFGILSEGSQIAVVRDGVYRALLNERKMSRVFEITRGSRPLNITIDDHDQVIFGEYGDLPEGHEKFIYASFDRGASFHVIYAFPSDDIRHIHNIIWDRFDGGYWVMVGDFDRQPGIGKLSADFKNLEWLRRGDQESRAVGVIVEKDYLYYGTDSELCQNYIVRMDKKSGQITRLLSVEGSSLYATRFGDVRLISTCVEPSRINHSRQSVIYASLDGDNWQPIRSFNKDLFEARAFQFGTVVLPTSNYDEPLGMFSGQALAGCDNRTTLVKFENGSIVKKSDTGTDKEI